MQWWQDARFGMFVCCGPVSLTGLEIGWSRGKARPGQVQGGRGPTPAEVYDNLFRQWKPDKVNAKAWVRVAQDAGAKYMIFLVRHHDGFLPLRHETQVHSWERILGLARAGPRAAKPCMTVPLTNPFPVGFV